MNYRLALGMQADQFYLGKFNDVIAHVADYESGYESLREWQGSIDEVDSSDLNESVTVLSEYFQERRTIGIANPHGVFKLSFILNLFSKSGV